MTSLRSSLYRKIIKHDHIDAYSLKQLKSDGEFKFRTVVHQTSDFASPACDCAFLHEYFGYISNDGAIGQEDLDRICLCIDKGECPHVSFNGGDHHAIVTTAVSAIQVAIVTNNTELFPYLQETSVHFRSAIYYLSPSFTALMWQNQPYFENGLAPSSFKQKVSLFEHGSASSTAPIESAIREHVSEPLCVISQKKEPPAGYSKSSFCNALCFCVSLNYLKMFMCLLKYTPSRPVIRRALLHCVYSGNETFMQVLLQHEFEKKKEKKTMYDSIPFYSGYTDGWELRAAVLHAVINDNPEMLRLFEKYNLLSNRGFIAAEQILEKTDLANNLSGYMHALQIQDGIDLAYHLSGALRHDRCLDILKYHSKSSSIKTCNPFSTVVEAFMRTEKMRPDLQKFRALLKYLCESGFDINRRDGKGNTIFMAFITSITSNAPRVLGELILSGSNMDIVNDSGKNALVLLLEGTDPTSTNGYMSVLKMLLFNNPATIYTLKDTYEVPSCLTYVQLAISLDCTLLEYGRIPERNDFDFQLNLPAMRLEDLITVHLYECGIFPVSPELVLKPDTPNPLRQFLIQVTSQPRTLKMQCRDRLRRHYPGRQLHDFVTRSGCPAQTQEYILIRYLLRNHEDI